MKKRKDKGRDGMPIVRVLRSVVVAVQGPVCFYLPIKAVLRVGVLLVVALDRQGRMLATSETPRWQGRAFTHKPSPIKAVLRVGVLGPSLTSHLPIKWWGCAGPAGAHAGHLGDPQMAR